MHELADQVAFASVLTVTAFACHLVSYGRFQSEPTAIDLLCACYSRQARSTAGMANISRPFFLLMIHHTGLDAQCPSGRLPGTVAVGKKSPSLLSGLGEQSAEKCTKLHGRERAAVQLHVYLFVFIHSFVFLFIHEHVHM